MDYYFQKNIVLHVLKFSFVLANSTYPDEMPQNMMHPAAFYLGLHCLQKYWFRGFKATMC